VVWKSQAQFQVSWNSVLRPLLVYLCLLNSYRSEFSTRRLILRTGFKKFKNIFRTPTLSWGNSFLRKGRSGQHGQDEAFSDMYVQLTRQRSKGEAYLLRGEPEHNCEDSPFIRLDCRLLSKYLQEGDNSSLFILNGILITSHLTGIVLASCIVTWANCQLENSRWAPPCD